MDRVITISEAILECFTKVKNEPDDLACSRTWQGKDPWRC